MKTSLLVCGVFLVSLSARAEELPGLAVMDIQAQGVDETLLPTLTEVLTAEIDRLGMFQVIGGRDIEAMIGFEKQKEALACEDVSCLSDIGGALGVERLVSAQIGMLGDTYVVNIKLLNIVEARTEGRVYKTVEGTAARLVGVLKASVRELFGLEPEPEPEPEPAPSEVDTSEDPAPEGDVGATGPTAETPPGGETSDPASPLDVPQNDPGSAEATAPIETKKVSSGGSGRWIGSITFLSVALVAGGAAVGLGVSANQKAEEARELGLGSQIATQDAKRLALASNVVSGIAGAAALTGVLWMLLGSNSSEETAMVAPTISPDSAGLAVMGRF